MRVIAFGGHPSYRQLSEFSDRTLAGRSAVRVAAHIETCHRCLQEIRIIRHADDALRDVPIPDLPEGLLQRVLDRRAENIRTLLPADPVRPRRSRRLAPAVAGSAILFMGVLAVLVANREATADASSLRIGPPTTRAATVPLTYRPAARFRGAESVAVRALVWRDGGDEALIEPVGILRSTGEQFEGAIDLPPDAVFALLAIEDANGTLIDANGGDFWEFAARYDGLPTIAARLARVEALENLAIHGLANTGRVRSAAIQAAVAEPNSVELWAKRAFFELPAATRPVDRDSLLALHQRKLSRFVDADLDPSVSRLATLVRYAAELDDLQQETRLVDQLGIIEPWHPLVTDARVTELVARYQEDSSGLLVALDAAWAQAGPGTALMSSIGYRVASELADVEAISRWGERLYATASDSRNGIAREMSANPASRRRGIELLRQRLAVYESPPEALRPIHQSRSEFEDEIRSVRAGLLTSLGSALVETGDVDEGLAALSRAIDERWDPTAAVLLVSASLEQTGVLDDRARRLAAMVLADPLAEGMLPVGLLPAGAVPSSLDIENAREMLQDLLLRRARTEDTPDVALRSRVGVEVPIETRDVTLIALWQSVPALESGEVDDLASAITRLAPQGVRVLIASPEQWLDEAADVAERVGARPVVDVDGLASEAFGGWYMWEYVVIHDGWFSVHYDLTEASRLALLRSRY